MLGITYNNKYHWKYIHLYTEWISWALTIKSNWDCGILIIFAKYDDVDAYDKSLNVIVSLQTWYRFLLCGTVYPVFNKPLYLRILQ